MGTSNKIDLYILARKVDKMKKWRLDFRIWHWLHATVVLRKTFLSWRTNSELLSQKLSEINLEVTTDQAKMLAKAIRAPMWEWHIILGYALAALVVWRILLFFTQSGKQNYQNLSKETFHKKMVKLGYIGIYTVLFFMTTSGLIIHFMKHWALPRTAHMTLKRYMNWFSMLYLSLHLCILSVYLLLKTKMKKEFFQIWWMVVKNKVIHNKKSRDFLLYFVQYF